MYRCIIVLNCHNGTKLKFIAQGLNKPSTEEKEQLDEEEDDEEAETLLAQLPESTRPLRDAMQQARGCLLLLVLKQHLKQLYGFTDA